MSQSEILNVVTQDERPPEHRPISAEPNASNVYFQESAAVFSTESSTQAQSVEKLSPAGIDVDFDITDRFDTGITAEELRRTGIPAGHYVALAPGQNLKVTAGLDFHESHRQAVFVGRGELVVQDHVHGFRSRHFGIPGGDQPRDKRPTVMRVVVAHIRTRAIGWRSLGTHLVLFLDSGDQVVARLDSSVEYGWNGGGTWEFRTGALEALCSAAGIEFESQIFPTARQFVQARPEWTPPKMEFEVNHVREEDAREWGLAIALGLPIAFGLMATTGGVLLWVEPLGRAFAVVEAVAVVLAIGLTVWSHSRWRAKRSLSRRSIRTEA